MKIGSGYILIFQNFQVRKRKNYVSGNFPFSNICSYREHSECKNIIQNHFSNISLNKASFKKTFEEVKVIQTDPKTLNGVFCEFVTFPVII